VLESVEGMEIVGETDNGVSGFEMFRTLRPDVTLLGLRLPDSCSIDDLDNYLIEDPNARIVVLAEHAGDAEINKALDKGALGYICKDVLPEDLVKSIRTRRRRTCFA
jgi:DNA-binding NarL/FixJ family response regulator